MVRIWCLPIYLLDRQHLLGEHVELHTIYSVLTNNLKGYSKHPQTLRFKDNPGILIMRHAEQVGEMKRRGYNHQSPLLNSEKYEPTVYKYTWEEFNHDYEDLKSRGGILE